MKSVIHALKKVLEIYENFFLVYLFIINGLFITADICMRAFGIQGISWLQELSRYLLAINTLTGTSIAMVEGGHMIVDIVYTILPKRGEHILKCLTNLLCAAFSAFLCYYCFSWTGKLKVFGRMISSIKLPIWIIWVPICIAFVTMTFRCLYMSFQEGRRIFRRGEQSSEEFFGGEKLEMEDHHDD